MRKLALGFNRLMHDSGDRYGETSGHLGTRDAENRVSAPLPRGMVSKRHSDELWCGGANSLFYCRRRTTASTCSTWLRGRCVVGTVLVPKLDQSGRLVACWSRSSGGVAGVDGEIGPHTLLIGFVIRTRGNQPMRREVVEALIREHRPSAHRAWPPVSRLSAAPRTIPIATSQNMPLPANPWPR